MPSRNTNPSVGDKYSLTCQVTGDDDLHSTSITYQWFKNGDLYEDSEATKPAITFDSLAFHDHGIYACRISVTSSTLSQVVNDTSSPFQLILEGIMCSR